jgi:archaellum biogenesis ATPase FlaH
MAVLIPNIIKETVQSPGEILLFNYFKNENVISKDWKILHSFDIAQHRKKKRGEADFIFLIPFKGIICVEVKAHNEISRKEGHWYFGGEKKESPFEQVRDNSEEIIRQLKDFSSSLKSFVTHLVIFTHCPFKEKSGEWNSWELIEKDEIRRSGNNFSEIFLKHFDLSIKHHQNISGKYEYLNNEENFLHFTPEICSDIANYLRKDFECFVSPSDLTKDIDQELRAFSNDQYRVIDSNKDHNLILVDGYAGSGKTVLALELARRKVLEGKNVLFLYYNRLIRTQLGKYIGLINEKVKSDVQDKKISIFTLYEFFASFVPESHKPIVKYKNIKTNDYPIFLLDHLLKAETEKKYDVLIIDETQDFIHDSLGQNSLKIFNEVNLEENSKVLSEIYIFGGFRSQELYYKKINRLEFNKTFFNSRLHTLELNENCRNPLKISNFAELIGKIKYSKIFREDNLNSVDKLFYKNKKDQLEKLKIVLKKLLKQFRASDIAILFFSTSKENTTNVFLEDFDEELQQILGLKNIYVINDGEVINDIHKNTLRYATSIKKFKGLESQVCIILNICDFDDSQSPAILFTGATRAQYKLVLMFDEKEKNNWGDYFYD